MLPTAEDSADGACPPGTAQQIATRFGFGLDGGNPEEEGEESDALAEEGDPATAPLLWERRGGPVGEAIIVSLPREHVEHGDAAPLADLLHSFVAIAADVERNAQTLMLWFRGYDDDPREVFEVPEVRALLTQVAERAPWWVHLVHPTNYIVWFVALGATNDELRRSPDGRVEINVVGNRWQQLIEASVCATGELCHDRQVPEEDFNTLGENL